MSMYSRIPIPSVFTMPSNPLSKKELIVEQMAPLSHFELSGPKMLEVDPEVITLFEKIDWKLFFCGFSGHNEEVTRRFALSFDGNFAQIGDLQLVIDEEFISKATKLPQTGERWFKG